ncbi:MAG: exo-alpha-sialidase [Alphaproteobacteria bacterium]|nr:exo-alpha-sialidase [Alphaproteobacteria bacterium]
MSSAAAQTTIADLARRTHFHGLSIDAGDPSRLFLATHHGFYVVASGGTASLISSTRDDFMGFTPHPSAPATLYASGHPAGGGNLGVMMSTDGGRTWRSIAAGENGPVDFHQMDVSKADPRTIYGVHDGLQVSMDAGKTWRIVAPAPAALAAIAASSKEVATLYAATRAGLFRSKDGGRTWHDGYLVRKAATVVATTSSGEVYAFILGVGLVRAAEPELRWQTVSTSLGKAVPIYLAVDGAGTSLYAVTVDPDSNAQTIVASSDGGKSWRSFGDAKER